MVDRTEDDPFWQKYKASNAEAGPMSIADLLSATVVVSIAEKQSAPVQKVPPSTHYGAQKAKGASPGVALAERYFAAIDTMASTKFCALGVPTPVTLSQPTSVCKALGSRQDVPFWYKRGRVEQSVPNETT